MDSHIEQLLQVGVLTGSRAFHCSTPESDWDIVILESDCDRLWNGDIINDTQFDNWSHVITNNGKAYWGLSEHPGFEDEDHLEYDQHTIWGPLVRILKYHSPESDAIVNLFVYEDKYTAILPKFVELNNLMNFLHGHHLADKQKRIKAFTNIINHVGITNFTV